MVVMTGLWVIVAVLTLTPQEEYFQAETAFRQRQYTVAEPLYEHLKKTLPMYRNEMEFRIAECALNLGDYERARKILESLKSRVSGTYLEPEVRLLLGWVNLFQQNWDQAEAEFQWVNDQPAYRNSDRVRLALGFLAYRQGKLEEATKKLEGLDHPLAQILLARIETQQHQLLPALSRYKALTIASQGSPLDFLAVYGMMETLLAAQDYQGILHEAQNFLASHPKDDPLRDYMEFYLAVAAYELGDKMTALSHFADLSKRTDFVFAPHAAYFAGNIKLQMGKPDEALMYYQTARSNANDARLATLTFVRLVEVFYRMGLPEQALLTASQLQDYMEYENLAGIGMYLTGSLSFLLGDPSTGLSSFKEVIQRTPSSPFATPAATMALLAMLRMGEVDQAITFGNMLQAWLPTSDPSWTQWFRLLLAEANYAQGNYAIAENLYAAVAQEAQTQILITRGNVGRAWCLLQEQREDEAYTLFDAMANLGITLQDSGLILQAFYGRAVTEFNRGQYLEAYQDFSRLIHTFPDRGDVLPDLLYYQGLAAWALKAYGDAVAAWENLVKTYPDHPRAAQAGLRAAEIYQKAGKYEESNTLLQWVIDHFPNAPEAATAQFHLGRNAYNTQNYEQAIVYLQTFLHLYPDHEFKDQAEELIQYAYYWLAQQDTTKLKEFQAQYPTSPLLAEAEFARAVDLYNAGQLEPAATAFLTFALNHPSHEKAPKALLIAGQVFYKVQKYEDAWVALKKLVTFYPDAPVWDTATYFLGLAAYKTQRYQDAVYVLTSLLSDSTFRTQAVALLASSYESMGELKKATEYYITAGDWMLAEGDTTRALEFYQYAYNLSPDPEVRSTLKAKMEEFSPPPSSKPSEKEAP